MKIGTKEPQLEKEQREGLAIRLKTVPAASKRILGRAERRLVGSIKRGESGQKLAANAERVRQAQLGCFHAKDRVAEMPTDDDNEQTRRHRENLAQAKDAWERMSVDQIVAFYSNRPKP